MTDMDKLKTLEQIMREEVEKYLLGVGGNTKYYQEFMQGAIEAVDIDNDWDDDIEKVKELYRDWLEATEGGTL